MAHTVREVWERENGSEHHEAAVIVVLLGDVHARRDHRAVYPRTRKARAMLALLAVSAGGAPRQRLISLLWSDRGEDQARASVRQAIYELRALLGQTAVRTAGDQVMLEPGVVESDVAAILRAPVDDPASLIALLDATQPEILGGIDDIGGPFDDWLRDARLRLAVDLGNKSRLAAEATLSASPEIARRLADHALAFDPYDERALRVALAADAKLGDQARLHRRYRDTVDRLAAELNAHPSQETRHLYERLRLPGAAEPLPPPPAIPDAAIGVPESQTRTKRRRTLLIGLILLALVMAAGIAARWWTHSSPSAPPIVAVLPFQNLSRTDDPYFASGIAEEVQNLLSRAPDVEVLGRASASQFGRGRDVISAARALNVTHLLDGSVRADGNRVLVIVRLIRAADGTQLWSERYDRRLDDVFAVQGEIAEAVMRRFAQPLPQAMAAGEPPSPAVYDRYLSARSLMRDRRAMPLGLANQALREAIALQPEYAPARALLAQVLLLQAQHPLSYGMLPYSEAFAEATSEARLAARLDPSLGEAQAAIGLLTYSNAQSVPYYRRAVALEPQRADFHRWLGQSLMAAGRYGEALAAFRRAVAIDPLWGLNSEHLVAALEQLGRHGEAAAAVRRFQLLSRDELAQVKVLEVYAQAQGRLADSYRYAARVARLSPQERQGHFRAASALAALGERAAALRQLAPDDWAGRLTLMNRIDALDAAVRQEGAAFWDTTGSLWNVGDVLVAGGKGATLLQLFDSRFGTVARYRPGELIDAFDTAPLIVAMRRAGRGDDAAVLLRRLQRQLQTDERERPNGYGMHAERAIVASLAGDRAAALRLTALAVEHEPMRLASVPYRPVGRSSAFGWLAEDPALQAIDRTLLAHVNGERRKLGWPPLIS